MTRILFKDPTDESKFVAETEEHIIVKGGDGSLLRAVDLYSHRNKPFYGVAGGTENYLMNPYEDGDALIPIEGHTIKKLHRIKVQVEHKNLEGQGLITSTFQAFNDVCIGGSDGMNSWIDFDISDKDASLGRFKGGGLIISTPQGSTGINKTNGGSILLLSSNLWSVTGDKTNRKIKYVFKPRRITIMPEARCSIIVWVDGANHVIDDVFKITLSKGDTVEVIFNDYESFKVKRREA